MKTWLVALLLALLPCVAGAAGLGRITVLSALGQPLIAEIDLVAVTPQELSTLNARLALPDAYRQANLQYNVALTGARVTIEKRPNGQSYLKVAQPASGYAVTGVTAHLTRDASGKCASAGIGVTGVASKAFRAAVAEKALIGTSLDAQSIAKAAATVTDGVTLSGDIYASEQYRHHLAVVYARRAIEAAAANAK